MSVQVISTPYKSIGSESSRWVAINNDVAFKVLRSDRSVVSISAHVDGDTIVDFPGADMNETLTVGGYIYLKLNNTSGVYKILDYTTSGIHIDLEWPGATDTGVINFVTDFLNYHLRVSYEYSDDDGSTWKVAATSENYHGTDCLIEINVSPFFSPLVSITSKAIPSPLVTNDKSDNIDRLCRIIINEVYRSEYLGDVDTVAYDDDLILNIVDSAQQIQALNGVNLKLFHTLLNATTGSPTQQLRFLGAFQKPTYFLGYPFHLSFIFSELMETVAQFKVVEQSVNINGTSIAYNQYSVDTTKIGHVNRAFIRGTYGSTVDAIKVYLGWYDISDPYYMYSETKTVKYKYCDFANPVCIKWIDATGAWNFWVFGVTQTEGLVVGAGQGAFSRHIDDLETSTGQSLMINKEAVPELTMGADGLDSNDIAGLKTILNSPRVMMLVNYISWGSDGVDYWVDVKPLTGRFKMRDTKATRYSFELTVQQNELISQTN